MRTVSTIARYLAGVIFFVFGLNGFLNFIPLPPPEGTAAQFMGALYASHYLMVIFAFQIIAAIPLLVVLSVIVWLVWQRDLLVQDRNLDNAGVAWTLAEESARHSAFPSAAALDAIES